MRRARKILQRLRPPALVFMVMILLHLALSPAAVSDCHNDAPHDAPNHACCHCSCCMTLEFSADDYSFTDSPCRRLALEPELLRGRDVIFQLYRPPQSSSTARA